MFFFLELLLRVFFPLDSDPYFNQGIISFGDSFKPSDDPFLPADLQPNALSVESSIEYKINSKGLRDHEYDYEKSPETYRILALGDSVTMGFGVNIEDVYVKRIENLLKKDDENYEVVNLGVGGYNVWHEFHYLKKEGLKYNPDMIIFGFIFNDLEQDVQKMVKEIPEEKTSCVISYTGIKIPCKLKHFLKSIRILTFFKYRINNIFLKDDEKDYFLDLYKEDSDGFGNIFHDIAAFSEESGIPVVFVIFPLVVEDYGNYPYDYLHSIVKEELESSGLEFVDLLDAYSESSKSFYISKLDRCHPNKEGHLVAGDVVYDYLKRREE